MFKKITTMVIMSFAFSAMADSSLENYDKKFKLIRNSDGVLTHVQMSNVSSSFTLKPFVDQIKNDLKREISLLRSKSTQAELDELMAHLSQSDFKSKEHSESVEAVDKSFKKIVNIDIEKYFQKLFKNDVLKNYELELKEALNNYSLVNIAATQDPRYFYKRAVTYEVVTKALEYAKKKFSSVPVLNIASFVIVRVHDLLLEQRLYHQNMLLHYLDSVDQSYLGMTVEEANLVFSSIYESRISALNYRESNLAKKTWDRYGLNKFYQLVRMNNNKLRRNSSFDQIISRYNFSFVEVVENGERVIKNISNTKHMFSSQMATAFYIDQPQKVLRFRSLLNLGQVGLSFIPLPNWLKEQANSFIESYYVEQKRMEGALIGYFEANNDLRSARLIQKQLINPYIINPNL